VEDGEEGTEENAMHWISPAIFRPPPRPPPRKRREGRKETAYRITKIEKEKKRGRKEEEMAKGGRGRRTVQP